LTTLAVLSRNIASMFGWFRTTSIESPAVHGFGLDALQRLRQACTYCLVPIAECCFVPIAEWQEYALLGRLLQ
jgi:hypothetical protein